MKQNAASSHVSCGQTVSKMELTRNIVPLQPFNGVLVNNNPQATPRGKVHGAGSPSSTKGRTLGKSKALSVRSPVSNLLPFSWMNEVRKNVYHHWNPMPLTRCTGNICFEIPIAA